VLLRALHSFLGLMHGRKQFQVGPKSKSPKPIVSGDSTTFSIPVELVTRAKTRVAAWFDLANEPKKLRPKVLNGIELIAKELPRRASWFEVLTVSLDDSASLLIHFETNQFNAFSCGKCLAVSTIVPGWNFGWGRIFNDDEVHQILSWFLHYARQYIHRSYVARVLMVAWEEHGKVLHPFGSKAIYKRYGPIAPMRAPEEVLGTARADALKEWGDIASSSRTVETNSLWVGRNTLDPYLHQAVFHFLRGQSLKIQDFETEAVVAFDCVLQSVSAFIRARRGLSADLSRGNVCEQLGLPARSAEVVEYMYFIRNNFGAHAGGWRWWDQNELFDDIKLDEIALLTEKVLTAAADLEPKVRGIDPLPREWGLWLFENFDMLWNVVWFDRQLKWQKTR